MNWMNIVELMIANLFSGGLIVGVLTLIGGHYSKKALQKSQSSLDAKNYISKTRFDAEFRMYQELSEKNISMVYSAGDATRIAFQDVDIEQLIQNYCDKLNDAQITNRRYAPFIAEEMYERFHSLERSGREIFGLVKAVRDFREMDFPIHYTVAGHTYDDVNEVERAIVEKQRCLSDELNDLLRALREYLNKLDVMEDA